MTLYIHDLEEAYCAACPEKGNSAARCRWCNRKLTEAVSIWLGTGSTCLHGDERSQARLLDSAQVTGLGHVQPAAANECGSDAGQHRRLPGVELHVRTDNDGDLKIWIRIVSDE
ncbi:DUF6011 domain-containing protein [Phytoactinopolyspora halotolerans]|uniref:Uncharacterized protein n=1 Tax=Phytoactinopolyspora halotolerans TaxID=1981512 RepID=A0A6L9SFK8_9ACTN|nr:DUF6011 domain-containing protein [Phytoactinopolyspora halotolerans]NEE03899.1 hypothetical protein [Phytoactinopolyspora halotolerans]